MIRVVDHAFDPGAELTAFCSGRTLTGAVASFVGLARGDPAASAALELQAYAGFTEAAMAGFVEDATSRFGLLEARIVHRVGLIPAGEAIVLVLTAAAHRRAALEACDYLMDHLKSRAPLWKKEHGESEARWVEPTEGDLVDLERWVLPPSSEVGRVDSPEASGVGKSASPGNSVPTPNFPTPLASRVDPPHKGEGGNER